MTTVECCCSRTGTAPACTVHTDWLTHCLPACLFPVRGSPTRLQGSLGTLAYERPIANRLPIYTFHQAHPPLRGSGISSSSSRRGLSASVLVSPLLFPTQIPSQRGESIQYFGFFFSQAGNTLPSLETWNREKLTADSHSEELRKELSEPVLKMFQNQRTAGST